MQRPWRGLRGDHSSTPPHRQEAGAGPGGQVEHRAAGQDQGLLVGHGHGLAGLEGRPGAGQARRPDDGADDHVHVGVADHPRDAFRTDSLSTPLAGPGELAALWTKIGLNGVVQTRLTIRVEFRSFADYWEPFLGGVGRIGPYIAGLSSDTRAEIERRLRLNFLMGAPDGPRSFAATALAVRGVP